MRLQVAIVLLFVCVSVNAIELFTSTGKYDYGQGGVLLPGVEMSLIDQEGPGVINSFQFASDFDGYEDTLFRFYYDGETTPFTTAKLFKGMWHSSEIHFGSNGKCSFYITVKFPFQKSIRITAEIESTEPQPQLAYWSIRGLKDAPTVTIGDFPLPVNSRVKFYETESVILYPLETLSLAGDGHFEGEQMDGILFATQLNCKSSSFDYLEGRIIFTSGDNEHFLATGIDDYLGSAWWFTSSRGTYDQAGVTGLVHLKEPGSTSGHRIHSRDLVPWTNSFDLSIRNGDRSFDGITLGVPDITEISARVWTYQWKPKQ